MLQLWRNRPLMVTIIVAVILLVVLIITAGSNNVTGTESILGSVFSPVQGALYSATDAIGGFFGRIFSGRDIQAENLALSARVAELEGLLRDYNEVKQQNDRLKEMLNFDTQADTLEYVSARVIGKAPGHWFNIFIIDAGMSSGIHVNMPVVNEKGLIGRVVHTGANWSRVISIIDASSGVSGIVKRTRDNGMLSGRATLDDETALLTMANLPLDADLMPGDTVITSGLAGIFPKGIAIGEVVEVTPSSDGMRNFALVKPWVDFSRLEEVMIITTKQLDLDEALQ